MTKLDEEEIFRNLEYQRASERSEQLKIEGVFERIREIFKNQNENLENEDEESLLMAEEKAEESSFPLIIVIIALLKDVAIDAPLTFSLIGGILSPIFSLVFTVILFFWVLGKLSGGWWKKKLIRWLWLRYIVAIIIEFIPWINIVPTNTIFILMAHYREKKMVKLFNLALEELRGAGILKHIR